MKLSNMIFATVALIFISAIASAQQAALAPTQGGAPGVLPKGKIAFINTAAFQERILEYKSRIEGLNKQFEPRMKEIQGLGEKITSLETTIKSQQNVLSPAKIAEMGDQLESMKREYNHKAEDIQADANKARDQALRPFSEKLGAFAKEYTAKLGIVMLIDVSNALPNTVLWYDPRADVTNDFINEFNKANPVSAAPAPQKP